MPDYFVPIDTTLYTKYHRQLRDKGDVYKRQKMSFVLRTFLTPNFQCETYIFIHDFYTINN